MFFDMSKVFQNKYLGNSQELAEVWSYWFFSCGDTFIDVSIWINPIIWMLLITPAMPMPKIIPNIESTMQKGWIKL